MELKDVIIEIVSDKGKSHLIVVNIIKVDDECSSGEEFLNVAS